MRTIYQRKKILFILVAAVLVISVTRILFKWHWTETKSIAEAKPPAEAAKEEECRPEFFSSGEVRKMCSTSVAMPKCMVEHIDHMTTTSLDQKTYRVPGGHVMKIYLNHVVEKTGMARQLETRGTWESESVSLVMAGLKALPKNSALIDIGCSFGVYTLAAASLGYKVVAMDANYRLAMRVRKSVEENSLRETVDVFWNAISADRTNVKLRYPTANCDFGMLKTYNSGKSLGLSWSDDPVEVSGVGLDDVIVNNDRLSGIKNLILKVDIEGSEWNVFATAAGTFAHYNVPMVLMEWEWTAANFPDKTLSLCSFFTSRGFSPYAMKEGKPTTVLQVEDRLKWPPDVLWLNRKSGLVEKLAG